jgi:hypothetical protein
VLWLGSTAGAPGSTVQVPVYYSSDTNAVSLQFDLPYGSADLTSLEPVAGNALADHLVASSEPGRGVRRVIIFSLSNTPIADGVLVYMPYIISAASVDHNEFLGLTGIIVVSAAAETIPNDAPGNGVLTISPSPAASGASASNGGVRVVFGGTSGRAYDIEVSDDAGATWDVMATAIASNGAVAIEDQSVGPVSRMLRMRLVP